MWPASSPPAAEAGVGCEARESAPRWTHCPVLLRWLWGEGQGGQTPGYRLPAGGAAVRAGAIGGGEPALLLRAGASRGHPSSRGQRGGVYARSSLSSLPTGLTCRARGQPRTSPASQGRGPAVRQHWSAPAFAWRTPEPGTGLFWRMAQTLPSNGSERCVSYINSRSRSPQGHTLTPSSISPLRLHLAVFFDTASQRFCGVTEWHPKDPPKIKRQ